MAARFMFVVLCPEAFSHVISPLPPGNLFLPLCDIPADSYKVKSPCNGPHCHSATSLGRKAICCRPLSWSWGPLEIVILWD